VPDVAAETSLPRRRCRDVAAERPCLVDGQQPQPTAPAARAVLPGQCQRRLHVPREGDRPADERHLQAEWRSRMERAAAGERIKDEGMRHLPVEAHLAGSRRARPKAPRPVEPAKAGSTTASAGSNEKRRRVAEGTCIDRLRRGERRPTLPPMAGVSPCRGSCSSAAP
jgi:hypothetical protein